MGSMPNYLAILIVAKLEKLFLYTISLKKKIIEITLNEQNLHEVLTN